MKKYILLLIVLLLSGCSFVKESPSKQVEDLLSKYQKQDSEVINDLDKVLENSNYTDSEKVKYKELIKKQYKDLKYKITDEIIDKDKATVITEIEVYDYSKANSNALLYLEKNKQDFLNMDESINYEKYNDYILNEIAKVKDRVTYTINFTLEKDNNHWKLNKLSSMDIDKIHGTYY